MYHAIVIQSIVIIALLIIIFYQFRAYSQRTSELLDRLMAKNLPEFEQLHRLRETKKNPRVFSAMTDAEMAEYEKTKKALALVAHVDADMAGVEPII
jgi:biopolymer transport protein ExbB/TolQ